MRWMQLIPWFLFLTLCVACEQTVDKGDDKLIEGRQQMEVKYKDSVQTVYFDNLETAYPVDTETPVVIIEDIILGSGLVTALDGIWLNFIGEDGFTPIGVCPPEYAPTPDEATDRGYVERGTTRLIWAEELEFERCMSVKDVVTIEIADDPDELPLDPNAQPDDTPTKPSDDGVPFDQVTVHYDGTTVDVDVSGLDTAELQGQTVVLISTLLAAAGITGPYDGYTLDFEGSDGYRPSSNETCEEFLPAPGSTSGQGGIHVETSKLIWEEALEIDKCGSVKLVAHIYVEAT